VSTSDDIAALEAKLQLLITGGQAIEVEDNGKRVRYQPGDVQQLRELIAQKKAICGDIVRSPSRKIYF
jgi:hypothetical protein